MPARRVGKWERRLELVGKATGILLVLVGAGVYVATLVLTGVGRADPVVFSTGALFFLGGAGAGLSERLRRQPGSDSEESR